MWLVAEATGIFIPRGIIGRLPTFILTGVQKMFRQSVFLERTNVIQYSWQITNLCDPNIMACYICMISIAVRYKLKGKKKIIEEEEETEEDEEEEDDEDME